MQSPIRKQDKSKGQRVYYPTQIFHNLQLLDSENARDIQL